MNLYLLRHGQAEPYRHADAERALTLLGKQEVEKVARLFAEKHITLTRCYYSPLVRTTQTCQLFMHNSGQTIQAEPLSLLTHEHRASEVLGFLRGVESADVLLVTHNPLVSELLAVLTGVDTDRMHVFTTSELQALHLEVVAIGGAERLFQLQP